MWESGMVIVTLLRLWRSFQRSQPSGVESFTEPPYFCFFLPKPFQDGNGKMTFLKVTILQATAVQKFGFKNATSSECICVESVSMQSPHMQRETSTGKPHRVCLRQQSRLQMGWNVAQPPFSPGYDTPWLPQAQIYSLLKRSSEM